MINVNNKLTSRWHFTGIACCLLLWTLFGRILASYSFVKFFLRHTVAFFFSSLLAQFRLRHVRVWSRFRLVLPDSTESFILPRQLHSIRACKFVASRLRDQVHERHNNQWKLDGFSCNCAIKKNFRDRVINLECDKINQHKSDRSFLVRLAS